MPTISVLMPVYNTERYIKEAVESILAQTFADFEFIIIDDGSTDQSLEILKQCAAKDARIRLISRENRGILRTRNEAIAMANGEFIAVMDSDDISMPERFAIQVDYLQQHPDCLAVGCMAYSIDSSGSSLSQWILSTDHRAIDDAHLRGDQKIIHSAVMIQRNALVAMNGYRVETCEDLDLFLRIAEIGRLANMPELLHKVRRHVSSTIHTKQEQLNRDRDFVVRDAWQRRGLEGGLKPTMLEDSIASVADWYRSWAWTALKWGNVATARKHAFAALRKDPLAIASWRVVYCALRGR